VHHVESPQWAVDRELEGRLRLQSSENQEWSNDPSRDCCDDIGDSSDTCRSRSRQMHWPRHRLNVRAARAVSAASDCLGEPFGEPILFALSDKNDRSTPLVTDLDPSDEVPLPARTGQRALGGDSKAAKRLQPKLPSPHRLPEPAVVRASLGPRRSPSDSPPRGSPAPIRNVTFSTITTLRAQLANLLPLFTLNSAVLAPVCSTSSLPKGRPGGGENASRVTS
jgi:hypothetical protein